MLLRFTELNMNKFSLQRVIARLLFVIFFTTGLVACSSISRWESRFSEAEKVQVVFDRADARFSKGKATYTDSLIQQAKSDFAFLVEVYKHQPSRDRLSEIDRFYADAKQKLQAGLKEMTEKNNFLGVAGYTQKIAGLFPADTSAQRFMAKNKDEIQRQLSETLKRGNTALSAKDYTAAQQAFSTILEGYPDLSEAQKGLADARSGLEEQRKAEEQKRIAAEEAAKKRRAAQKKEKEAAEAETAPLSPAEQERLYKEGKAAFDKKDYLKAHRSFTAIGDTNYKDTKLYLQRCMDKITALKLVQPSP